MAARRPLRGAGEPAELAGSPFWSDTALFIALALAAFTIVFGTRKIDVSEQHEGLVAAERRGRLKEQSP